MKSVFIVVVFLLAVTSSFAQQDPLHAQYLNTPLIINPAYSGFSHDLNIAATYRKQWAGFEGSPQTLTALGHVALRANRMGVGAIILRDKMGANSTLEYQATYAYHLPLGTETILSLGLQAGAINYRTDYSDLTIDPNDPKFQSSNEWQPNFGAGAIITNGRYFVSVSAPKMLEANSSMARQGLYNRNFYFLGAYAFTLTSRLRFKPYVLYRQSAQSKFSYDLGANLLGDDSYTIGVFTRSLHTYGALAQLKLDDFIRVAYVFELPTKQSAGLNYPTHEVQVILRFGVATFHDVGEVRNF